MNITFTDRAWDHYLYWQQNDTAILARINELIKNTSRTPFTGIGKPEPSEHVAKKCKRFLA
jgi:toxin YoeB